MVLKEGQLKFVQPQVHIVAFPAGNKLNWNCGGICKTAFVILFFD